MVRQLRVTVGDVIVRPSFVGAGVVVISKGCGMEN